MFCHRIAKWVMNRNHQEYLKHMLLTNHGWVGQCFHIQCTSLSSERETQSCSGHINWIVSATAENWLFMGHALEVKAGIMHWRITMEDVGRETYVFYHTVMLWSVHLTAMQSVCLGLLPVFLMKLEECNKLQQICMPEHTEVEGLSPSAKNWMC